jgi:hypothetical protein
METLMTLLAFVLFTIWIAAAMALGLVILVWAVSAIQRDLKLN